MMNERFDLRGTIARGGAGFVQRAWDRKLNCEVAIKRVRDPGDDSLLREVRLLCAVRHPNIVACLDAGTDDEGMFLVMELAVGETLDQRVSRGVLGCLEFEQLGAQILEGLIEIHAHRLVHLDVKPENIVIEHGADGSLRVKLLDFGIAQFMGGAASSAGKPGGVVMGSLFFMAPERFDRAPPDPRADLYSLGCVCYHALTGQYPFQGDTASQVMVAHLRHTFVPLAELRPDLPAFVPQWIEWMFSRQLEDRPSSAAAALETLRQRRAQP